MKDKKRDNMTFFNEEWNQPFFEDNIDEIDTRKKERKTTEED